MMTWGAPDLQSQLEDILHEVRLLEENERLNDRINLTVQMMEEAERKAARNQPVDIVRCKRCNKPVILLRPLDPGLLVYCPECIPPNE